MGTLTREDLKDLFPGPENFLRRKAIWDSCHGDVEEPGREDSTISTPPPPLSPLPQTSTPVQPIAPHSTPEKVVKLFFPEYVVHTDTELEHVRNEYFELAKKGEEQNCQMSKDLRCRLICNTMTSMIAILRANGDAESDRYPSKPEVTAMAKRIVKYYPMLQDLGKKNTWATVYGQLFKRLQNVRSPQKTFPDGRPSKKRHLKQKMPHPEQTTDTDEMESTPSTEINMSPDRDGSDSDSPKTMAKHYKTLQALFKKKNPNNEAVSQLLDLEFKARRAIIDLDSTLEENRYYNVIEAYPCFKVIGHVMEELRRIVDKNNSNYIAELKERWHNFCQKVLFYGVSKNMMKCPMGMTKIENALMILRALPSLFPSPSTAPKNTQPYLPFEDKDPNVYLKKCPLSCPVLLVSEFNCLLAIGDEPIHTLAKCEVVDGVLYLMAYYYAIHLTYPKCVATLLSVIQTEVLLDEIHERDLTPSYKKAIADWTAFNNPRQ
ncbi:uncharacterized protein LOC127420714 isoform X1 [Xyrichtys novacula]|uniref:Uncharacterized protein LOC127420714 isoform X1 n=1 Tax=Xyrichtys novacula TaxID=13765 RepID=A0AAV1HLC6_XYRNO|nr:uncharacterized protein LOC127420714 isoform X1 [Xyrichtys novacula]